jgi:hypothetical protein
MTSRKFFVYLWRINGLLLLAAGLLAVGVLAVVGVHMVRDALRPRQVDNVANAMVGEVESEKARLGEFARVEGSEVLRAPLSISQSYSLGVGSKEADSVRNYLFVDAKSRSSYWLLPTMDKLILRDHDLPETEYGAKRLPVRVVVYTIVDTDSDKDGRLTDRDRKTVGITGPDGTDLRRVAEEVDELHFADLATPSVVTLVYSKGGRLMGNDVYLERASGNVDSFEIKPRAK